MMICACGRAFDRVIARVEKPCGVRLMGAEFEYGLIRIFGFVGGILDKRFCFMKSI